MAYTLCAARRLAGKTQAAAAALLGISPSAYRRLEQRPQKTTVAQARQLCRFFGVELDEVNFFAPELHKK